MQAFLPFPDDPNEQIARLEHMIKEFPQNKNPYYYLGRLYETMGEDRKAKQNYLDYLVRDIGFKDTDSALTSLESTDWSHKEHAIRLIHLGQIYCYLNRFDEAEELLKKGTIWECVELPDYTLYMIRDSYAFKNLERITLKWQENADCLARLFAERRHIKINYYFYESTVHKGMLTGDQQPGHCFPKRKEVHIVYNEKNKVSGLHEDCHVMLHHIGQPLKLIDEGFALYVEHGEDMHKRFGKVEKRAYPISSLLDDDTLEHKDLFVVYPQAGSFTGYLCQVYGLDRLKQICQAAPVCPESPFERTYGKTIDVLEREWLDFIAARKK